MTDHENEFDEEEVKRILEIAGLTNKVEQLGKDVPQIFEKLRELHLNVSNIPSEIVKCKTNLEAELKSYVHNNFISEKDQRLFALEIEKQLRAEMKEEVAPILNELKSLNNRMDKNDRRTLLGTAFVTAAILLAGFLQWLFINTNIVFGGG